MSVSDFRTPLLSIVLTYIITAIHHVYGAWLYETPWRNHIVIQGFIVLVICLFFFSIYLRWNKRWAFWVFFLLTMFFFVGAIGFYEGLYNHVLKNILYFLNLRKESLLDLYPPPTYELPNNFMFEITGVLTFIAASICAYLNVSVLNQFKNE